MVQVGDKVRATMAVHNIPKGTTGTVVGIYEDQSWPLRVKWDFDGYYEIGWGPLGWDTAIYEVEVVES